MFVVIFEVQPKTEQFEKYLELARLLRPELEQIDGFIDNERFRSTTHPERILSLSSWRDEKALIRWRTLAVHHKVQVKGRFLVFLNYRLRIGEVSFDTTSLPGQPERGQRFDETEVSRAKTITITELHPNDLSEISQLEQSRPGLVESELFESIYNVGKRLRLSAWEERAAVSAGREEKATEQLDPERYREVRVIRAYGMYDRRESPQYYPPLKSNPETLLW